MVIDEKTAQLILDALAWSNRDWMDAINMEMDPINALSMARGDFLRFCNDRGISEVERTVIQ